jgi:hypothetical protein
MNITLQAVYERVGVEKLKEMLSDYRASIANDVRRAEYLFVDEAGNWDILKGLGFDDLMGNKLK